MKKYKSADINKMIAKAYIFLLTFRMISPLAGLAGMLHGAGNYFDVILHVLGLTLAIVCNRGKLYIGNEGTKPLLKSFSRVVIWFCCSSVFMAFVMQMIYGNYAGETAFSGIIGQIVYYVQYVLMIIYNIYVFKILQKNEIENVLYKSCVFLLILGYYQMLMYLVGGVFRTVGYRIDVFDVLFPDEKMAKLSLTGSEGAKAGGIFAILVLPYLLAKAMVSERATKYYIQILLWIPIVVFMQSTSAYLMIIAVFLQFLLMMLKGGTKQWMKFIKIVLIVALIGILAIVILPENLMTSVFNVNDILYIAFQKVNDSSNGSTLLRTAPLIINWKTFLRFPILGVGNGLQGYFYTEFFPKEGLNVAGVYALYSTALTTIVNGALFFPSILSGYGIVGILVLGSYIKKMLIVFKSKMKDLGIFSYMFRLALVAIIVHGFQTEFAGNYFIWFVLSIPFM